MGRSLKKRKLKKVRRARVKSIKPADNEKKKKKKTIKTWEFILFGAALIIAVAFIIFAARTGSVVSDIDPTPSTTEQTDAVE
jgi:hypothetical protein